MGNVINRAEQLLGSKGLRFSKQIKGDWTQISLEGAPGADFAYFVEDYSDGNANLGARRLGAPEGEYFFYLPYEPIDFDSPEALEEKVLRELDLLVSNTVRIRRLRGFLFEDFEAEVDVGSKTEKLHGASAFRWTFKFQSMKGQDRIYQSPALTGRGQDG